jgi:cytochrome bd-type quinol oxidase subunit 1
MVDLVIMLIIVILVFMVFTVVLAILVIVFIMVSLRIADSNQINRQIDQQTNNKGKKEK